MPDRDCEWEDALGDAGADFGDGLPAVAIEVEPASLNVALMDSITLRNGL